MSLCMPISLSLKQQLFAQLCEQFEYGIFILDANFRYLATNDAYETMFGYPESFLLGRSLGIYAAEFFSIDEKSIVKDIHKRLNNEGFYENDFSIANRYGQKVECHITCRKIRIDDIVYYVGVVRDTIDRVVKNKTQMAHLLNFNKLTGLPNRKVFLSQISELLIDSYKEVVVIRLNIDRYRILSSTFGQDSVDDLIKDFVARVNELALDNLICFSHFDDDDFGLLFELSDANMVRHQLDSLMQMIELPFSLEHDSLPATKVYLQLSAGVSYFPKDSNQVSGLMTKAEKALHYVKQQGGDDICWYNDSIDDTTRYGLQLEAELRTAINSCQFVPHYQPIIAMKTGEIVGFEALVRWQHPTRGLLKPIDFIDAIIKHKLSFELFCQMATQIVKQLSIWQAKGFTQHVCINADAAEFSHPDFFSFISHLLDEHLIQPSHLHIELTESSLMLRHASVKQQLTALKELGLRLSLDDFGTGYASLSYLQEYPFDFIKIDKGFISKIAEDDTQYAIVKAILDLAGALDLIVVAEGIENKQQSNLLLQMGCNYGQGYYFSYPITAMAVSKMLREQRTFN